MGDILDNSRARSKKDSVNGNAGKRNTFEKHCRGRFDNKRFSSKVTVTDEEFKVTQHLSLGN